MKTQITIKISSRASSLFQLSIDDNVILKTNHPYEKSIEVLVEPGVKHILSWFIKGNEGEEYSIQITKPVELPEEKAALGDEGMEIGQLKFTV